jgi:hypothetical protein
MEYTAAMHNMDRVGDADPDTITYLNAPWGGVRFSNLQNVLLSNATSGKLEIEYPIHRFGLETKYPNLDTTGGFTTFAQNLDLVDGLPMPRLCGDANGYKMPQCPDDETYDSVLMKLIVRYDNHAGESAVYTNSVGEYTLRVNVVPTVEIHQGCNGYGCQMYFWNQRNDMRIEVNRVLHWTLKGERMYVTTDGLTGGHTADDFNAAFKAGDEITVLHRVPGAMRSEDNTALTFVHGTDPESQTESWVRSKNRMRFGFTTSTRDYTVYTINPKVTLSPGRTFTYRQFILVDNFDKMENRAAPWVDEVSMDMYEPGEFNGETISLYSADGGTTFGATVGSSATCNAVPAAQVKCTGVSFPQATKRALFAIRCPNASYVGTDRYALSPDKGDPVRSYLCAGEDILVRPTWTLLGYFTEGDCADLANGVYEDNYCHGGGNVVGATDAPSASPSLAPTVGVTTSGAPTTSGTTAVPTADKSTKGTAMPSSSPTAGKSTKATAMPSLSPTTGKSTKVTAMPSSSPSSEPSPSPTVSPTKVPTPSPTVSPTKAPTMAPTRVYPTCLHKRPLRFSLTECSYEKFVHVIANLISKWRICKNSPEKEIQLILKANDHQHSVDIVNNACLAATSKKSSTYLPFEFIANSKKGTFEQDYFNGGSSWNEVAKRPTSNKRRLAGISSIVELRIEAKRVAQIKKLSSRRGIHWPSQIPNFQNCNLRAVTCCWVKAQKLTNQHEPMDNTDVCYADFSKSPASSNVNAGYAIFEQPNGGGDEGPVNCHGFAWGNDPKRASHRLKGNALFEVAMYEAFYKQGYVKSLPGAPMCGCVEQMPTVTRADCTEVGASEMFSLTFVPGNVPRLTVVLKRQTVRVQACTGGAGGVNNDLSSYYDRLVEEGQATVDERQRLSEFIVGEGMCGTAVHQFLKKKGLVCQASEDVHHYTTNGNLV